MFYREYFKRLPVEVSKISYVAPIGVLAPVGGSPLPKQHTGFMLNEFGVPIFAPGDLTITQIRKVTYNVSPTRPGYIDYAIFFSVCDEVRGHFGHITNLNQYFNLELRSISVLHTALLMRPFNRVLQMSRSKLLREHK